MRFKDIIVESKDGVACPKTELTNEKQGIWQLRPFNIDDSTLTLVSSTKYYNSLSRITDNRHGLEKGDILFNNTNSTELIGKVALVDRTMKECIFNHLTCIRVDRNDAHPSFVAYYLQNHWAQRYFANKCVQWVNQAGYKVSQLELLPISLPPLEEQKPIVEILDRTERIKRHHRDAVERAEQLCTALRGKLIPIPP